MYKQVIVVRDDIQMSRGKTAAQVAHGSILAYIEACDQDGYGDVVDRWHHNGMAKVVLVAPNLQALEVAVEKAKKLGVPYSLIVDEGRTELPPHTTTVLGLGPADEKLINKITGSFPLLK